MSSSLEFPVKNTRDAKLKAIWMQKVCTLVNTIIFVFLLFTTATSHLLLFSGQVFLFIVQVGNDFIIWGSLSTETDTLSVSSQYRLLTSSRQQEWTTNGWSSKFGTILVIHSSLPPLD